MLDLRHLYKEIIDEYLRVLTYPRFKLAPKEIESLLFQEIVPFFDVIGVKSGKTIVKSDPSDDKFIQTVLIQNLNTACKIGPAPVTRQNRSLIEY